jgi:DNA-directed RNA polymerase specialized sigma24 family protein
LPETEGPPDAGLELERRCERAASLLLYGFCERGELQTASPQERADRERAYADLGRYLLHAGPRLRRTPGPGVEWPEVVQSALIEIHHSYRACKAPEAFLAWCVGVLNRVRAGSWKQADTLTTALDPDVPAPAADDPATDAGRVRTVDAVGDQDVLRAIHDCLSTLEERLAALCIVFGLKRREILLVFGGDDQKLTNRLDNARRAALRHLRECGQFMALVQPAG